MQKTHSDATGHPHPASFSNPDRISLSISSKGGRFSFEETENTAPETLRFDTRTKTLEVNPGTGGRSRPFFFYLEFVAVGFAFQDPVGRAVVWEEPKRRASFFVDPDLDAEIAERYVRLFP